MHPHPADDDLGLTPDPDASPDRRITDGDGEACPTRKQLAYLRALATRTGQTFAYPRTAGQASREIRRLKAARRSPRREPLGSVARSPTRSPAVPRAAPPSVNTTAAPATARPPPGADRSPVP
jgi:hypothetical protein